MYNSWIEPFVVELLRSPVTSIASHGFIDDDGRGRGGRRLEARVPGMRNKGRIRQGADADIVIFDPLHTSTALPSKSRRPCRQR